MARYKPGKTKEPSTPRPLAVLSEDDRYEYALRHNLILQKQMEYQALADSQDAFREHIVEKYGLPQLFDLNLVTGEAVLRPKEEVEANAENGRV